MWSCLENIALSFVYFLCRSTYLPLWEFDTLQMTPCERMQSWCRCDWWSLFAIALPVVSQMLLFVLLPGALLADLCQALFLVKPKAGEKRKKT